jgi:hypothetical protein
LIGERIAGIAAFAVVVAGLAAGFAAIGPPRHVRLMDLDRRRVSDLQSIARRIQGDTTGRRGPMAPATSQRRDGWPHDPETGRPYDYRRESATRYRLCATFALAADSDVAAAWRHGAGRTCYRLDAASAGDQSP